MAIKLTKKEAAALQAALEQYDSARSALAEMLDDLASDWESEWADKSERWQESEAGQTAQERIDLLRATIDEQLIECDLDPDQLFD